MFGVVESKSGNNSESVSSQKACRERELRNLLKDKELFTEPDVIKRFMFTGYGILLMLLGSFVFLINIEVMFAERLQ